MVYKIAGLLNCFIVGLLIARLKLPTPISKLSTSNCAIGFPLGKTTNSQLKTY